MSGQVIVNFYRNLNNGKNQLWPYISQQDLAGKVGVIDGFIIPIETGRILTGKKYSAGNGKNTGNN